MSTAPWSETAAELIAVAGRRADRILTSDLAALPIETVAARGEIVAEAGLIDVTRFEKTDLFLPA